MHSYSHLYLPQTRLHVSISRALPLALAFWRIFPHCRLRLVTCSVITESNSRVTSFRLCVCHACRAKLSAGFRGGEPWSPFESPGPYPFPFWASPLAHVGLFPLTTVPVCSSSYPWTSTRRCGPVGLRVDLLFIPLPTLGNQSPAGG